MLDSLIKIHFNNIFYVPSVVHCTKTRTHIHIYTYIYLHRKKRKNNHNNSKISSRRYLPKRKNMHTIFGTRIPPACIIFFLIDMHAYSS